MCLYRCNIIPAARTKKQETGLWDISSFSSIEFVCYVIVKRAVRLLFTPTFPGRDNLCYELIDNVWEIVFVTLTTKLLK